MNRKLIAAAVVAGLAAPLAAQADVTVYGRAQAEMANSKLEYGGTSQTVRGLKDNNMGRIGVKAAEDLGDGMTGFAKFEFKANTVTNNAGGNNTTTALTGRDAYVGIKGGYGIISFGRQAGPYKDTNLDPYIATTLEARNFGGESSGNYGHASFINDSVKYINTFGNLRFEALMTAGNTNNTVGVNGASDSGNYQVAFDYKGGPWRVIAAYSRDKDASGPNTPTDKRTKLAAQYQVGSSTFTAQYEKVKNYTIKPSGVGADAFQSGFNTTGYKNLGDTDFYLLSYGLKMANHNGLYVRYAQEKYKGQMGAPKNKVYMVALDHRFSKTFRIFTGYQQAKMSDYNLKVSTFSVGMRKDF